MLKILQKSYYDYEHHDHHMHRAWSIHGGFETWTDDVICLRVETFPGLNFCFGVFGVTKLGIVVRVSEITKYHATEGKIMNETQ